MIAAVAVLRSDMSSNHMVPLKTFRRDMTTYANNGSTGTVNVIETSVHIVGSMLATVEPSAPLLVPSAFMPSAAMYGFEVCPPEVVPAIYADRTYVSPAITW